MSPWHLKNCDMDWEFLGPYERGDKPPNAIWLLFHEVVPPPTSQPASPISKHLFHDGWQEDYLPPFLFPK